MKICSYCKILKPFDSFSKARKEKDGHQYKCKACCKIVSAAHRAANPEKERDRHRKYQTENKDKLSAYRREWNKKNPDKLKEKAKKYFYANREKERERHRKWRESNSDRHRTNTRKWRMENLEYARMYDTIYAQENKEKVYAKNSKRRAKILNATVAWADLNKIIAIYAESVRLTKKTGIKHHVDHIVPLKSKVVCGLHWEGNLQILTAKENLSKNNRFDPAALG